MSFTIEQIRRLARLARIEVSDAEPVLECVRDFFYRADHFHKNVFRRFKRVCIMSLGDDERMPRIDRLDIEKGERIRVLVDFFCRNLSGD